MSPADAIETSADEGELVSYGRRISDLAAANPTGTAFIFVASDGAEEVVTWERLDLDSNRAAHVLRANGLGQASLLAVCLPNSVAHIVATLAAWKLGACVLPLRGDLPAWELGRVLDVGKPDVIVAAGPALVGRFAVAVVDLSDGSASTEPFPDCIPNPARAIATSGSTGTPKIIIIAEPGAALPLRGSNESLSFMSQRAGQIQLIPAPLYHTNGFFVLHSALFQAQSVILMERFEARLAVDLIERHRVNSLTGVTIMLQRIARLPDIAEHDLSSLTSVLHGGAPLPQWLAHWWINLVGPEHFGVSYGSSENAGVCAALGTAWLTHRGTVGFPLNTELLILDEQGNELPVGEVGRIHLRRPGQSTRSFDYVGDVAPDTRPDFFTWLGDLGSVDSDGYLYLADRRVDMIISGGSNIFPAEVESALSEHPAVSDVVVVGLPDAEWGRRVHAIIELNASVPRPSDAELRSHCKNRLAAYKVPKDFEIVDALPRSGAGKIRRSQLSESRSSHEV